jgi:hypothetical protein
LAAALLLTTVGCAPETDLFREGGGSDGDPTGTASAAGALIDPRAGATDVPWNLAAVTARLPAAIVTAGDPFRLGPDPSTIGGGDAVGLGPPEAVPCPAPSAGACYRVPVAQPLVPSQAYLFEVRAGTMQEDGAAAAAGVIGAFDTAAEADTSPPRILDLSMGVSGPCVALRFSTDEPVAARILLRPEGQSDSSLETVLPAGTGATSFDLAVPLTGAAAVAGSARVQVVVALVDRAGNGTEATAGEADAPLGLPPLAITEVLANPAGPEPAQEFVELRNLGTEVVSLLGLRVEDSKGGDALPDADLPPGAYALVVPSGYDPQSPQDVPPRSGTVLVRVDARIGSDGLSNGGELVRLRMPGIGDPQAQGGPQEGPIISLYGGWVDVSASKSAGKSVHRLSDGACDHPGAWTAPPRDPTPGWGTP